MDGEKQMSTEEGGEMLDSNGLLKINDHNGKYFPIAIVGVGLRMPGAENITDFEKVLVEEKCSITPVPKNRWHLEDHHDEDSRVTGHHAIDKMAFCEKMNYFDPEFFGYSPREAHFIDPQQTLLLEVAEEAAQDAGYTKETLPRDTGVFIGMGLMDFPACLIENRFLFSAETVNGIAHTCAANRISQHFGLTGPSLAVDTACAAALTALHFACTSLWTGEISAAIAGATSYVYSPETTIAFSQMGVLSPTGNSAPFDVTNDGYVRGEGSGVCLLKPLRDAIRDGDHVYCVIRASASSHNGFCNSITLPSVDGQAELIRKCYSHFGIPMEKISFIEAHGTGTPVGDPIEAAAIGQTVGKSRRGRGPLRIQSSKSNFGHLEVAAGMVQIFKVALMLEKRVIYKQINWTQPNPKIDMEELNITIPVKSERYTDKEKFLIGVNTFGFGGSLVHMVLEEYTPPNRRVPDEIEAPAGWTFGGSDKKGKKIAIPLSAKSKVALVNTLNRWLEWEDDADAQSVVGWLATRREHYDEHRLVILADSGADFRAKIRSLLVGVEHADVVTGSKAVRYQKPSVCFFYADCGQHIQMGRSLYENSAVFRRAIDECNEIFEKISGYSVLGTFGVPADGTTDDQSDEDGGVPAKIFLQIGLTRLLASWGLKPDIVIGDGLGELSAAFATGTMTLEQTISFMYIRQKTSQKGGELVAEIPQMDNGVKPSTARFFSTTKGEENKGDPDESFWYQNVIGKQKTDIVFVELSPSAGMRQKFDRSHEVLSCWCEDVDGWTAAQRVISALHVTGYPVDWAAITEHSARYARIPLYGFDDRFFQLESSEYKGRRLGLVKRTFKEMNGRINLETFTSLRDNTVNDELVLTSGSCIEYLSEFVEAKLAGLKDIQIYELPRLLPLTADGHAPSVQLDVRQKNMRLFAVAEDGRTKAVATIAGRGAASRPPQLDVDGVANRCGDAKDAADVYGVLQERGASYGRCFRLIEKLVVGRLEALATCKAPYSRNRFERIEGPVLESAFQAAIAAFTTGSELYLPRFVAKLQMFVEKVPAQTAFCIHVSLKEHSPSHIACDLTIAAVDGTVWLTIDDLRAENVTPSATDVDYNSCCYETKLQTHAATMPTEADVRKMLAAMDTTDAVKADGRLEALRKMVASLAKEAAANVEDAEAAIRLDELSSLFPCLDESSESVYSSLLDTLPEISTEASHLRDFGERVRFGSDGNRNAEALIEFLRESLLISDLLAPYAKLVKEMIEHSLQHKDVVRVGELGENSAVFTKQLVELLQKRLEETSVDYTYIGKDDDSLLAVYEYLSERAAIKYEPLNGLMSTGRGSFDVIVVSDLVSDATSRMGEIRALLRPGGTVLVLKNARCQYVYDFLSLGEQKASPPTDRMLLSNAGLRDVAEVCYSEKSAFSALIGRKPIETQQSNKRTYAIVHTNKLALAEGICGKLTGKTNIYTASEFLAECGLGWTDVSVLCLIGDEHSDVDFGLSILTLLNATPEGAVSALYVIYERGRAELRGFAEMLLAKGAMSAFSVYAIGVEDYDSAVPAIVNTVVEENRSDRDLTIVRGQVVVPRVQMLSASCRQDGDRAWQLSVVDTGNRTMARFSALSLSCATNDVRIRIRGVAIDETGADQAVFAYSGIIDELGAGVGDLRIGEAVIGLSRLPLRSHVVADVKTLHAMPSELGWSEAADSLLCYTAVHTALVQQANVQRGQTLLVDTTSPSIAQATAKLATFLGLKAIFACRGDDDEQVLPRSLGVLSVANPLCPNFKAEMMNFTDGRGVDVVLQMGTEGLPRACIEVLACRVHVCNIGVKRTAVSSIPNARHSTLNLSSLAIRSEKRVQETVRLVVGLLDRGLLSPVRVPSRPFDEFVRDPKPRRFDEHPFSSLLTEITVDYRPAVVHGTEIRFRADATYVVVTGRHPELAVQVIRWLTENGASRVALVLRDGEESFSVKAVERRVKSANGHLYVIRSDMASRRQVEDAMAMIREKTEQPIRSVFHVNDDDDFGDCSEPSAAQLRQLFQSQLLSLQLLDEATASMDLEHFVAFTSADAVWTNHELPLRTAVASAVAELCQRRKALGGRAVCVQLGQLRGVGSPSTTRRLVEIAEKAGSKSLHIDEYLTILGTLLQLDNLPAAVAVTHQNWDKTKKFAGGNYFKFQHLSKANGLSKDTEDVNAEGDQLEKCKHFVATLLGADPEQIDPNHPMIEYGVDSLMSQDIINWAAKKKITIEQTDIFAGLTINHLLAKMGK